MGKSFFHPESAQALVKLLVKLELIDPKTANYPLESAEYSPIAFFAKQGVFDEWETITKVANILSIEAFEINKGNSPKLLALLEDPLFQNISTTTWSELRAIPICFDDQSVAICTANPLNHEVLRSLSFDLGYKVKTSIGKEQDILAVLGFKLNSERHLELDAILEETQAKESSEEKIEESNLFEGDHSAAPVIRLVNKILSDSVEAGASDIHINPDADALSLKVRVDGIMRPLFSIPKNMGVAVVSRIKLLGGMDISERRKPQDGRFRIQSPFGTKDLRLSTVPTIYGENIVIRILSSDLSVISFDSLGMDEEVKEHFLNALKGSSKIILVTGPTGSGKTSTLYGALRHLHDGSRNIVTVEDPIEYRIQGIGQIQVNEKVGLSFAEGLRSILRQDPDVIMVGEIRDAETASIAIQAAQTGHLVLSTMHTNTAPAAVTRLLDLGIPSFLIASSIGCILSQRLVRRLCPYCSRGIPESKGPWSDIPGLDAKNLRAQGKCEECSQAGYKGRLGIFSLLNVNQQIRDAIRDGKSEHELELIASGSGYKNLWTSAIRTLNQGLTTFSEAERILGPWSDERETRDPDVVTCPSQTDTSTQLRKRKVLLVEDDEDIRAIFAMLLQQNFYEVVQAEDGLDGLEKLYGQIPDIIICDLMMPKMGGIDFVKKVKGDPRTREIPILVLTAAVSDDNQLSSLQFGADDFVSKGTDARIFLARLERLLGKAG